MKPLSLIVSAVVVVKYALAVSLPVKFIANIIRTVFVVFFDHLGLLLAVSDDIVLQILDR